jgi:hypothetical protein
VYVTVKNRLSRVRTVVDSNIKPGHIRVLFRDLRLHFVKKAEHRIPFRSVRVKRAWDVPPWYDQRVQRGDWMGDADCIAE